MKLMKMNGRAKYLALVICMFSYASIAASESAQFTLQVSQAEPAQITQQNRQAEEINERMTLYKRIKSEQNKKVLMQLLHDIADIQKQCRDKGYLCSVEGSDTYESLLMDLNQAPVVGHSNDALPATHISREAMPNLRLLGIVGGRARFGWEDGRIKDFALGELVADFWKVTEIGAESALLVSKEQPDIKMRYQIHREIFSNDSSKENVTGAKQ